MQSPDERAMKQLEEAAVTGSEKAGEALTSMVGFPVTVRHLETRFIPSTGPGEPLGFDMPQDRAAIGRLDVTGTDIHGNAVIVLGEQSIADLLSAFEVPIEDDGIGEIGMSMLREVSNITASSYLNALADAWNIELIPGPPELELAADAASDQLELLGMREGPALVIRCEFAAGEGRFELSLVLMVDKADIPLFASVG